MRKLARMRLAGGGSAGVLLLWSASLPLFFSSCSSPHAPSVVARVSAVPAVQESISPDENQAIAQIRALLTTQVLDRYHQSGGPAQRDAHPKGQGCVKARFTVLPSIPLALRAGIFAREAHYRTWIRFSNAVGTDDHFGFARGMAIKLLGVPGQKILPAEANETTQDFLLVNYPIFNVRTDPEYVDFLKASDSGHLADFYRAHPESGKINAAIDAQKVSNPLLQRYFSMTPYALGNRAVKYSTRPITCVLQRPLRDPGEPIPSDPNYLRKAMIATLASGPSCFVFLVQPQTDPAMMPIEDATVLWSERISPFVPVALIYIPKQRFDSPAQQAFCENLSFTPWHSLPDHRPLGNINRIRRVVYDSISALRHRLNGVARREPTGHENFEGSPAW